jgi:hypothetical protein
MTGRRLRCPSSGLCSTFSAVEADAVSRERIGPRKRCQELLDALRGSSPAGNIEKAPDVRTSIGVLEGLLAREITLGGV